MSTASAHEPSARAGCVLIVDDSASMRMTLRLLLSDQGLEVLEAANGFEALSAINRRHVDLMICDLSMPEFDGRKLNRMLASRAQRPRVLVMSGYRPEADPSWGHDGLIGWLEKPFEPEVLLALVARGLGQPRETTPPSGVRRLSDRAGATRQGDAGDVTNATS